MFAQRSLQPRLSRRRYGDVSSARVNRNVFSLVQNCVRVSDESRTVSGREFHSDGPETLKLLCPYLARLHHEASKSPRTADRKPYRR